MPTICHLVLLGVMGAAVVYFTALDWLKVRLFTGLALR